MTSSMEKLLDIAALGPHELPEASKRYATLSLFDWLTVLLAGADQPLSIIIRDFAVSEGGKATASIAGSQTKVPARLAALANGTISHALDYDDTHFAHIGHLSVGIYPAALAVAEEVDAPAASMRDAFLAGAEAACRFGMVLGRSHYQRGFHQTATAGSFGSTIAAGRLYGLDRKQMRNALSLVSTRASGLKSQFGTMGKPFNAGISASNGVEAANLARRGFVSCDNGIDGPQGFIATHSDEPHYQEPWLDMPPGRFRFDNNQYKLHACCHGTHAMIEVLLAAKRQHGVSGDRIGHIEIRTHPRWLAVCDIKQPRTGLEAKFSYGLLAAMVLSGINTASEKAYVDALCADPKLVQLADRVTVTGDDRLSDTAAEVIIDTVDGKRIAASHDLSIAIPPDTLTGRLQAKSEGLLGSEVSRRIWQCMGDLELLPARALGELLRD